ncbi:MAG: hypothetical protein QXX30_04295 [Candidatus Aenigmatarchaeota archaeon]
MSSVIKANSIYYPSFCIDNLPFQTMTFLQMYLINKQLAIIAGKKEEEKFQQIIKNLKPYYYDEYSNSITLVSNDFISSHDGSKNIFSISSTNKDKNNSILLSIFNTESQNEYKVKLFSKEKGFIDCCISSEGIKIEEIFIKPINIHNFYTTAVSGAFALEKISAIFEESSQKLLFMKSIPDKEKEKRIKVAMEVNGESFILQNPMAFAEAIRRTTTEFERYAGPFYMRKEKSRTFIGYRTKEGEFIKEDEIIDKDIMYVSLLTDHPATIRTEKGKIIITSKKLRYMDQSFKIDKLAKIRMSFML